MKFAVNAVTAAAYLALCTSVAARVDFTRRGPDGTIITGPRYILHARQDNSTDFASNTTIANGTSFGGENADANSTFTAANSTFTAANSTIAANSTSYDNSSYVGVGSYGADEEEEDCEDDAGLSATLTASSSYSAVTGASTAVTVTGEDDEEDEDCEEEDEDGTNSASTSDASAAIAAANSVQTASSSADAVMTSQAASTAVLGAVQAAAVTGSSEPCDAVSTKLVVNTCYKNLRGD